MKPAPDPNAAADRARLAHDETKAYILQLFQNPAPPRKPVLKMWNMDVPIRIHYECHDDGVSIWIDDAANTPD